MCKVPTNVVETLHVPTKNENNILSKYSSLLLTTITVRYVPGRLLFLATSLSLYIVRYIRVLVEIAPFLRIIRSRNTSVEFVINV